MRIVLDTNVFVSGVFFLGKPFEVLRAWRDGLVTLVVIPEIVDEYRRVGEELARRFKGVDLAPFLALLEEHANARCWNVHNASPLSSSFGPPAASQQMCPARATAEERIGSAEVDISSCRD